jgi:hypothetical protein
MGEYLAGCRSDAGKSRHGSCATPLDVESCPAKTRFTGISCLLGNLIIVGNNKAAALDGDLMDWNNALSCALTHLNRILELNSARKNFLNNLKAHKTIRFPNRTCK